MERTKERPTVTENESNACIVDWNLSVNCRICINAYDNDHCDNYFVGRGCYLYLLYTMWSKRLYTINTVIGSVSGAVPPLIGWAAIDSNLSVMAWVLFLIMFIWQPPHF